MVPDAPFLQPDTGPTVLAFRGPDQDSSWSTCTRRLPSWGIRRSVTGPALLVNHWPRLRRLLHHEQEPWLGGAVQGGALVHRDGVLCGAPHGARPCFSHTAPRPGRGHQMSQSHQCHPDQRRGKNGGHSGVSKIQSHLALLISLFFGVPDSG